MQAPQPLQHTQRRFWNTGAGEGASAVRAGLAGLQTPELQSGSRKAEAADALGAED